MLTLYFKTFFCLLQYVLWFYFPTLHAVYFESMKSQKVTKMGKYLQQHLCYIIKKKQLLNRKPWLQEHDSKQHGRISYAIKGYRMDFREIITEVLIFFKSTSSENTPGRLISKIYKNAHIHFMNTVIAWTQ